MSDPTASSFAGDRLAKVLARSGLCSRRDAEGWIKDGRIAVNGKVIRTPAFNVTAKDKISVDGEPLAARQGTRLWLYHKPAGLVVTEKDPEGRDTIFEALAEKELPRVVTVGRLDLNTEGLLLLTNDGGLKRVLELPSTGWLRRYRVRAHGTITQPQLEGLAAGIEVDGIKYGPIEATLERQQGANVWLLVALREGKNREVKNVLGALGLEVNRLIRVSYGPFQLGDLPVGEIEVVPARILREQLGKRLAEAAGADFESEMPEIAAARRRANPRMRAAAPGAEEPKQPRRVVHRTRFVDDSQPQTQKERPPVKHRPGGRDAGRPARPAGEVEEVPKRRVLFEDGRQEEMDAPREREERGDRGKRPAGPRKFAGAGGDDRPKRPFTPRGEGTGDDRPKRPFKPRAAAGASDDGTKRPFFRPRNGGAPGGAEDRPKRPFKPRTGAPSRGAAGEDAQKRPFKPRAPRPDGAPAGDRPPRKFGSRPGRPDDGGPRKFGSVPSRGNAAAPGKPRSFGAAGPRKPRPEGAGDGGRPPRPRGPRPPRTPRE